MNFFICCTYYYNLSYEKFKDTIENIFKYSTFLEAKVTDKREFEHINDEIIVNSYLESGAELNELENVTMTIKKGTLTKESATVIINDLNGNKYSYGEEFRVDKYEDGEWKEVKTLGLNYVFNMMAYGVDLNGILEFNCNFKYMYGELEPGEYRIVKYALPNLERPVNDNDKKYFSVEFTLK